MDEINTQANQSSALDVNKPDCEQENLYQLVLSLTEEVRRLTKRIEELENTPKQTNCVLCPNIHINIPINIPVGANTSKL